MADAGFILAPVRSAGKFPAVCYVLLRIAIKALAHYLRRSPVYNCSNHPMQDAIPLRSPSCDGADPEQPESLRRLLESRAFEKPPALRALLTYLWQHRGESISEYAIATEALGRTPGFDARTDATVRVQISRLRQRLEKFYEE